MKPRTVLITGARAPVALEWARQFHAEGWRVLAADSMPRPLASWSKTVTRTWRVPPARHEPEGFVRAVATICQEEAVDVVLPVCEEIFTLAAGRARLPAGAGLWAADLVTLQELHDKGAFISLARSRGLPVPETRNLTDAAQVSRLSGDWFLKPCYSRFAVAGRRWPEAEKQTREDRLWLARQEISPARPWVAQEFLPGQGWCITALVEGGRVLDQVCYPVEWTAGRGACVAFTPQPHPGVARWVQDFLSASDFCGQIAFDFIEVPGRGVLPLECNPRGTSGLHLMPDAGRVVSAVWENPELPHPPRRGPVQPGQLTVPMLLYGLPQAVRRGLASEWLQTWRRAREATSQPGDRTPAWLGNGWTLLWFARAARRLQCGLTAATTEDLEWNGPALSLSLE